MSDITMPEDCKCVIILSSKSSGSSALQYLLTSNQLVNKVNSTRHKENETLFWAKAASILNRPQVNMVDSEVPIPPKKARRDLIALLRDNGVADAGQFPDDETLVYEGWRSLCKKHKPVFLEKSPHHIHQASAIELIVEAAERLTDIEFYLIGLVRNPMDTLYSMWQRWRSYPELTEPEWITAYSNLQRLKTQAPQLVHIVRYEDLISQSSSVQAIFDFIKTDASYNFELHSSSLSKWKTDKNYGFQLSPEAIELAEAFGYERSTLVNSSSAHWNLKKRAERLRYKSTHHITRLLRNTLKP